MIAARFWNSLDSSSENTMRNVGWRRGENRFQMVLVPEGAYSDDSDARSDDDDSVSSY